MNIRVRAIDVGPSFETSANAVVVTETGSMAGLAMTVLSQYCYFELVWEQTEVNSDLACLGRTS